MPENNDLKNIQPHLKNVHAWHYDMLVSQERNRYYNNLIKDQCRDKVVFEIGTGSGLLSVLAVRHGAKKVICCEENPLLAMAAESLFKRLGVADKIQLIKKNSNEIPTADIPKVDVILHELFGSDPFEEHFIPTLTDAQRFMNPGAIFLPEKIQILYQPIKNNPLPERLYFEDIELIEMNQVLRQVHPGLRQKSPPDHGVKPFALPEVTVQELISGPTAYQYDENNEALIDVDAIEVSYNIIHGDKVLQAASFEPLGIHERVHWFPLVFYKIDVDGSELTFGIKDGVKLTVE